jgi:hypothetical protein
MNLEAEGPAGPLLGHLGIARPDLAAAPLRLRASGAGPLDALALRLEGDLAEARLEAQTVLDLPQDRLQSRLTLRHPGAARLLGEVLGQAPPDWIGEGSLSLIVQLGGRPGAWTSESFEIVAGELRGRGQGSLAWAGDRPTVSGRLAMESLPLPALDAWHLGTGLELDLAVTAERVFPRGLPALEGFAAQWRADAAGLRLEEMRGRLGGGALQGSLRLSPNFSATTGQVAHHRGQDDDALRVGQTFSHAMAHTSHQRMGGAQVNAHRNAPLVRVGRFAGLGNL